ncbi:MAG: DUF5615 family PIN-like protein [Candidatus Hydrogenedentes bacterium]|nr:DUF5615 family PIN-like protein [Candidatus Hydrogenedentota bacterium]
MAPTSRGARCLANSVNLAADGSVDARTVARSREDGHAVPCVGETGPSITDDEVLDRASADEPPLVTGDKDRGEFVWSTTLCGD